MPTAEQHQGLRAIRTNLYAQRQVTPDTSDALREIFGLTRRLLTAARVPYRTAQQGHYQLPLISAHEYDQVRRQHARLLHTPFKNIEDGCRIQLYGHLYSELKDVAIDGIQSYCIMRRAHPRAETYALSLMTSDQRVGRERKKIFAELARVAMVDGIRYNQAELPMFTTNREASEDIIDTISRHLPLKVDLQELEVGTSVTEVIYSRHSA